MKQAVVACLLYVTASQVTEAVGGRGKKFGGGKFRSMIKNKLKPKFEQISKFCDTTEFEFDVELCNCAAIMKSDRSEWTGEQKVTARFCKDKLKQKIKSKLQGNDRASAPASLNPSYSFKNARREILSEKCETVDETDVDAVFRCRCFEISEIEPENRSVSEAVVAEECLDRRNKKMEHVKGNLGNLKEKMKAKMEGMDGEQRFSAKKCIKARMAIGTGRASEQVKEFFEGNCGEFKRLNDGVMV